MKRIFLLWLGICLACVIQAQEVKRIVSLAPFITQNLYLLEANKQIVGCTRFCMTRSEDRIEVVADALNAYVEKIVALQPDIVLAGGLTEPKVLDALERMGVKTKRLTSPRNFKEVCNQFLELGELSGKQERAQCIVKQSQEALEALVKGRAGKPALKVFMEIGCNPLFTVLSDSFMQDYIELAGGVNVAKQLDKAVVSKEFVLLQDPDVIFIVGMGIVGEEESENWKKIKSLRAVKNNKVFLLDSYVCSPTPMTFVDTVKKMMELMY